MQQQRLRTKIGDTVFLLDREIGPSIWRTMRDVQQLMGRERVNGRAVSAKSVKAQLGMCVSELGVPDQEVMACDRR